MIIDCHTHLDLTISPESTASDLVASMKKAGISKAFVYAGSIFGYSTDRLLKELGSFEKNLFPIGSISPLDRTKPNLKQIEEWLSNNRIYGLKFYPGYEYFYPTDKVVKPYLSLLERYRRPAIFHSGDTYDVQKQAKLKYVHPLNIDEAAVDFPNMPVVIAHLGFPWIIDTAEVVYKNQNVYVDCSGLFYGKPSKEDIEFFGKLFLQYLDYGGTVEKVLFGTDWPLVDQKVYASRIKALPIGGKERPNSFAGKPSQKRTLLTH